MTMSGAFASRESALSIEHEFSAKTSTSTVPHSVVAVEAKDVNDELVEFRFLQ